MDVVAAIGTIQTMHGIIKGIIQQQAPVVKYKKEVEEFAKFVGLLENQLKRLEVNLKQPSREETLSSKMANSLHELLILLKESKHVLEKLATYRSIFTKTNASVLTKLQEKITVLSMDIIWEMVNPDEQCNVDDQPFHPQPQGSASYYPPDHADIGWKAYRDGFEGILQQPPTKRWETSLKALATVGERSVFTVRERDTTEQPGNQSPSGEIDHIAPSTNQRHDTLDSVERRGSDELKLLSAQLDTVSITPMDRNSTQQELSVLSNPLLRRDVRENGFHHEFDPKRAVSICEVFDDAVQILFLHVEGMTTLFGVGLPFSLVALREEDVVEIKQLPRQVWTDSWSNSESSNFSLVLLDCSIAVSDSTPRNVGQRQALSPEDAAEQYGVGLLGSGGGDHENYVRFGDIPNAPGISLSWIASLRNDLISSCRGDGRKEKGTTDPAVPSSSNSGSARGNDAMDAAAPSSSGSDQGATPHEDHRRSQGHVTTTERGMQNQPPSRHLTVRIRLRKERCNFYNTTGTADSRILPRNAIPRELQKFWMEPNVVIRFLYYTDSEGRGIKKMRTSLDVHFTNDSACRIDDNDDKFGWYHDRLLLSFKSTGSAQVTREKRREEDEILSQHSIRSEDRGSGRETSTAAVVGRGRDGHARLGNKHVGHLQGQMGWKKEDTVARKDNLGSSSRQDLVCLDGMNFSIQPVDMGPELAHLASMYPPLASYDVWNDADRRTVSQTRIMGTVRICIGGDWEINEEADDFGPYDFSCQRDLIELQRSTPRENQGRKSIFSMFSKPIQKIDETSTKLQQKLICGFIINHSFSHMQRLQRPEAYSWNMAVNPSPVIDMISSS